MASVQDRSKLKRVSYDTWSTREQLCLASSVLKSGDQNWSGVSRSLKPFAEKEALRPPDWFSQKSCAIQYAVLLENADAPKRKKRESGETTSEAIVKRLTQERIAELGQILAFQRDEYQQLKAEVLLLRSGTITEEKLQKMWLAIEQEERDQEQKARAHAVWLAKRQHKQEAQSQSLQTVTIASPRKSLEQSTTETQETGENEEEERKNRGGRSPLLTSLLKSPSPTTQMQSMVSSAQPASSPTIAGLLGSTPKISNAQLSTSMPTQLHQLVTSAMTNAVAERPSVGAPTLSMLLELPANLQRGSLASLQQAASNVQQQIAKPEIHMHNRLAKQTITQTNENANVGLATVAASSVPANESMVQIIDQVDDVIRKDTMADVINKDEINEIIGDLEELIKEEITASSPQQTVPPMKMIPATVPVAEDPPMPEVEAKVIVSERPEPRNVDEAVSLSNSPQSEMAIEEIDQSTSSIAEIIGTVAIEPLEPKITVVSSMPEESAETEENNDESPDVSMEELKVEEDAVQEASIEEESIPVGPDASEEQKKESTVEESGVIETKPPIEEAKIEEKLQENNENVVPLQVASKSSETSVASTPEKEAEKQSEETLIEEMTEVAPAEGKNVDNSVDEVQEPTRESTEETKKTAEPELDEIKLDLSKITDERNEVGSAEGVCTEVTTDIPSVEDNEKSQDIAVKLEGEGSSQSNSSKKNNTEEQLLNEILDEVSESRESSKDSSSAKEPCEETINENSTGAESSGLEITEENIDGEEAKVEDTKDSEKDASSTPAESEKKEDTKETTEKADLDEEFLEMGKTESDGTEEKLEKEEIEPTEIQEEKEEKEEPEEEEREEEEEEEEEVEEGEEEGEGEEQEELKVETVEKEEKEETEEKGGIVDKEEETELEESVKPEVCENEDKKCVTPVPTEEKLDVKEESDTEGSIKLLEEPKKEEVEIKEEREEDEKRPVDSDVSAKKETIESAGSICDDIGDLDEEESSLSKLSGGRAMKTYSKKQTIAVDSEPENESSGENADYRAWKKAVMLVYNRLATHKYASVFLRPITEDQAPGYHSVIFRPMDLSTIKKNIDNGTIRSTMHFQRDVMLMFQNAIMYNKQDTFVYKMAVSMQEECLQHMQILVQVTGEGQLRRETRTAASSSTEISDPSVKRKRSHVTPSPHDTDSPRGKKRRKSEND